jgi:protein phosphatase 1 regulatory subunit 7
VNKGPNEGKCYIEAY